MALIERADLHDQPHDAVAELRSICSRVAGAVITEVTDRAMSFEVTLKPSLEFAAHGWPNEPVRIVDDLNWRYPIAFPLRPVSSWKHRNPIVDGDPMSGALCLWYERDPKRLRWTWQLGLEQFITLVHRHLLFEEGERRGHPWPMEDAPHGERTDGRPHPIKTHRRRR